MWDAHHHFWAYDPPQFGWINDAMAVLRRDFGPGELEAAIAGTGVDGVISVQARSSLDETAFLLAEARQCDLVKGVVGWVPLSDPNVGAMLDPLVENLWFKGVREVIQGQPDDAFFGNHAFHRGLHELTRRDVPFDLLVHAHQLQSAMRFVDAHPEQRFVLDHIGKPVIRREAFDAEWARDLRALAERERVLCKFSGVVTEVRDDRWDAALIRPYFETALEAFGARRLLFGSDWPVCLTRTRYDGWVEVVRELAAPLTADERQAFFVDNTRHAYTL
jgi:L-fuconolactonase